MSNVAADQDAPTERLGAAATNLATKPMGVPGGVPGDSYIRLVNADAGTPITDGATIFHPQVGDATHLVARWRIEEEFARQGAPGAPMRRLLYTAGQKVPLFEATRLVRSMAADSGAPMDGRQYALRAPVWATGVEFTVGELVVNAGTLYRCLSAHVAGSTFTAGNFAAVGGGGVSTITIDADGTISDGTVTIDVALNADVTALGATLATKADAAATTSALASKLDVTARGANNGVASLDGTGRVPSAQLPSYVDDVVEGASLAAFPATGETGKIYVAVDTSRTYRWGGSAYVLVNDMSADLASRVPLATFTAKGDIAAGTGPAAVTRLTAGSDGQLLAADSAAPTGLTWVTPAAGTGPASAVAQGTVQLAGDIAGLGGTASVPRISGIQGVQVSTTAPTAGQILAATSGTAATWTTPAATPAATTTAAGIVQLAGDLAAGTATAPIVTGVRGVAVGTTVPTAGQVLTASDGTAAAWMTPTTTPTATTTTTGTVTLAGDLAGAAATPTVARVNGVAVTGTPTAGQVPTATSGTAAVWTTPTPTSAATTTSTGVMQLAGDLAGGTAAAPTVTGVRGVAVDATAPTAGQVLTASSGTAAAWVSPTATPVATTTTTGTVTLAGDLAGTGATPSVARVNGTSVPAAPTAGQVLTATSGTAATWQAPAVIPSLANRASWAAATAYVLGDIVTHGGLTYIANTAGTASAAFATDASRWTPLDLAPVSRGAWVTATAYAVNHWVTFQGGVYVARVAHTASAAFTTDAANWIAVTIGVAETRSTATSTTWAQGDQQIIITATGQTVTLPATATTGSRATVINASTGTVAMAATALITTAAIVGTADTIATNNVHSYIFDGTTWRLA